MRKSIRNIVAISAMTLPLAVGATSAFAATDAGQQSAGVQHSSSILGNGSIAPVTQINPAINIGNLLGGQSGGTIAQDNGVDSSTTQVNAGDSTQHQDITGVQSSGKHRSGLLQGLLGGQSGKSGQVNGSYAPVTQINPAINVSNLLGGGQGRHHKSTGTSSVTQHNGVTSSTTQANTGSSAQHQSVTGVQTSGKHRSGLLQGLLGGQSGKSAQGNGNVAPVTQINPAINISNLLGGNEGRHHKSTEKTSDTQHNGVTSSTTQANTSTTTGDQNVTGTQSH